MADRAAGSSLKPLSWQDWEILMEDFQHGGVRLHKWTSDYPITTMVDLAISSLVKKEFPLKVSLLIFLEEFSLTLFSCPGPENPYLDRLIETLRFIIQSPVDNFHISYSFKEQIMISTTSILISLDAFQVYDIRYVENVVELLLTVINRPNHGLDRQTRAIACECLRQLEIYYPCLLSDVAGHLWTLCQSERTHASQSYILLFTTVICNVVNLKLNVSILNTSIPLVPFTAPHLMLPSSSGLNYKELRRAMAFLLEWPQVLTPCGMLEFLGMIMPVAVALELQPSMLKVQFSGMIYSFDPVLCHVVLIMFLHRFDTLDGQECDIVKRLMLVSKETQQYLVFRLLAVHWLLGFLNKLVLSRETGKINSIVKLGLRFYPSIFDPLALKTLKLDLLAFCIMICPDILKSEGVSVEGVGDGKSMVKLFEDGVVSVSAYKWLPPSSTETAVAFRTFHKFLIGASSHTDTDPSTTRILMDSTIFHGLQGMLVDVMLESQRLVLVIVALIDRLLDCQKHRWLGERLLQTVDEHLLPKVIVDYRLVSFFPVFDRIAENDTIPPGGLLELLTKFMAFLVEKHGPDTGLKSWSQGSKVLGNCRTMLMNHHSSRLFIGLSRLLAFTCLYFPDLEIRDHARIYLRLLICVPGGKLRGILNLGEQLLSIAPSSHSSSFFSVQSPRHYHDIKKSKSISSYIHLERVTPLLVKQSWSLSLSTMGTGSDKSGFLDSIKDTAAIVEVEFDGSINYQMMSDTESSINYQVMSPTKRIDRPPEPLRVMDSKISEILGILRRHFSCIPDFRHITGLKVRIQCSLRFESEPFTRLWGGDSSTSVLDGVDALPALYATVLKFSSSAPYGSISSCHIPFLLGKPARKGYISGEIPSLDVAIDNGFGEEETFRASVTIDLEPREPTPGLIDVFLETNAENGQIIHGQLNSITVGIEDMFLQAIIPPNIPEDVIPDYYSDLFNALWEACGTSSNIGRETFPLKGGKGVAAINGIRSVKLLEVPSDSLIRAIERYLAPFVVSVSGEQLINMVKDGGIIRDIRWNDVVSDSFLDLSTSVTDTERGPLHLTYIGDDEEERESQVNISKRNLGCFLILIFLPPRFHLLFRMEVCDVSTLVRIRTDHWPCLAYVDSYLEALVFAE